MNAHTNKWTDRQMRACTHTHTMTRGCTMMMVLDDSGDNNNDEAQWRHQCDVHGQCQGGMMTTMTKMTSIDAFNLVPVLQLEYSVILIAIQSLLQNDTV